MPPYLVWYIVSRLFLLLWARRAHVVIAEIMQLDTHCDMVKPRTPYKYFLFLVFWDNDKPHSKYFEKKPSHWGYAIAGLALCMPAIGDFCIAILAAVHLGFFIVWAVTF